MSNPQVLTEPKPIPPEIDRWNWGAFLLSWIWGVGNNTFIALLALIPIFGQLVMPFVLGAKGSRWAWRNGRWDSVEHFKRVQRQWAIWGAIIWLGSIVLFGGGLGAGFYLFKHSEAYKLGVSTLQASPVATNLLGMPITAGFPSGSINYQNASAKAVLSFSASGPKAAGTVFLEAIKKDGAWAITRLALKLDGRDGVIDLVNGARNNST
jgi:Cytochrome oxidase complex assembly protein 1